MLHDNPYYADDSQIQGCVAKFSKPGGSIWQLFRNDDSPLDNVTIRHPGIKPDGSNPCATPILGDVDGDGQPSCSTGGGRCLPDYGDLYAFCRFPSPFPSCDSNRPIKVLVQSDCADDVLPGNKACDLAPGAYGKLTMDNATSLNLVGGGDFVFCDVVAGKNATIMGTGATVYVPDPGEFKLNNGTLVGNECGEIRLLKTGPGTVRFGRSSTVNMRVCAPEADVELGHGNKLHGQFFGSTVDSDQYNEGGCCPGMCACFDTFDPKTAGEGAAVTMKSHCSLTPVTDVQVCGQSAPIVSRSPQEIVFTVPAGTSGQACDVDVVSPAGLFTHKDKLTVP